MPPFAYGSSKQGRVLYYTKFSIKFCGIILAGHWMDAFPGAKGYKLLFGLTAAMLLIGLISSIVLYRIITCDPGMSRGLWYHGQ